MSVRALKYLIVLWTLVSVPVFALEFQSCDVWEGQEHGECVRADSQGNVVWRAQFQKGIQNGTEKLFWPDGQLREERSFRQGVLQGPWRTFHPSGRKSLEGEFEQGLLEGALKRYDSEGLLLVISHYTAGKREGLETYFSPYGYATSRVEYRAGQTITH